LQKTLDQQIERAKELLGTVLHAAMATVNEDGSPHNTPYFFMCNADLTRLYWGSHSASEHSKNVARTGQLFVVLYEADSRGGLFIRADNAHVAEGTELDEALAEHNRRRALQGKDAIPLDYYQGGTQQRMYVADTRQFWVNGTDRGADGLIIRDIRTEISRESLQTG
jgi:hypothetical protein